MALLDRLHDAHVDDLHSVMHEVTSVCSVETLARLSAADRRHHEHCYMRLQSCYDTHLSMERDLARRLGYLYHPRPEPWQRISSVRDLTVPDDLPHALRPLLGKWLRATGRLAQVHRVRCRSWTAGGFWFLIAPVRAGEPQHMRPEERAALDELDTPDGLLKTVLRHAAWA
jgi:hypothetical protein